MQIPLVVILGLILSFAMFSSSGGIDLFSHGLGGGSLGLNLTSEDITLIILVVVTLVAIYWLVSGGGSTKASDLKFKVGK